MGEQRSLPRLGRFLVADVLGDGGTATVYLAWDTKERRWTALKALHHKYLEDEEMRRRFSQEAEALRQLHHENICAMVHHDDAHRPPYLVLELARRGSTMDWLREHGKMPPAMAADVIFQICQALAEAHAAGIVHRDVKPHNFLLDDEGRCKLTDFGIARLTETTSFTATGSQIGTFSFMAPEQRSDTKSVDLRADIYSVGASLYTLLTARTSAELFVSDQDDELLADVPVAFRPVILRATRYRAEDRYGSVLELQTDLMNALSRIPPDQASYPPLARPRDPLPIGPPKYLAPGVRFEDLEKSLPPQERPGSTGSSELGSTPAPSSQTGRHKVMPYYMATPPPPPSSGGRGFTREPGAFASGGPSGGGSSSSSADEEPSYVDRIAPEKRATSTEAAKARWEASLLATAKPLPPPTPPPPDENRGIERVAWAAAGIGGVAVLALCLVLGFGWFELYRGARETHDSAAELQQALAADGSVVYEIGGNRASFETLYATAQAGLDAENTDAAVAFVRELETLAANRSVPPAADGQVRRLQTARNRYLEAMDAWRSRAVSMPGRAAIKLGIGAPPP